MRKGVNYVEKYEALEMEVIIFESEDVISASGEGQIPTDPIDV